MLKYQLITAKAADSDGDWRMVINILEQDAAQTSTAFPLSFEASNGWAIKSTKVVEIDREGKIIYLRGIAGNRDNGLGATIFKKKDDMLKAKLEIEEALEEWAKRGGFDNPVNVEDFTV